MFDSGDMQSSFVMTLKLDDASFAILQKWRNNHFPPRRNLIPAHLTLFHTVSAEQITRLRASWAMYEEGAPLRLRFARLRLLGNGVAVDVESVDLHALRARFIREIAGCLTRQDQQPFCPHVTIQNKVEPGTAKALHRSMSLNFEPWEGEGTAVITWLYLGGPWQQEAQWRFNGEEAQHKTAPPLRR